MLNVLNEGDVIDYCEYEDAIMRANFCRGGRRFRACSFLRSKKRVQFTSADVRAKWRLSETCSARAESNTRSVMLPWHATSRNFNSKPLIEPLSLYYYQQRRVKSLSLSSSVIIIFIARKGSIRACRWSPLLKLLLRTYWDARVPAVNGGFRFLTNLFLWTFYDLYFFLSPPNESVVARFR